MLRDTTVTDQTSEIMLMISTVLVKDNANENCR